MFLYESISYSRIRIVHLCVYTGLFFCDDLIGKKELKRQKLSWKFKGPWLVAFERWVVN